MKCGLHLSFHILFIWLSTCADVVVPSEDVSILPGRSQTITVQPYEQITLRVTNISTSATALICQVHTLYQNLTLSLTKNPEVFTSVVGSHIGVETVLKVDQDEVVWYLSSDINSTIYTLLFAYILDKEDPLPGGCNLEFDLEVDPNIHISETSDITSVIFQKASVGVLRSQRADCEVPQNLKLLEYELYAYYLPANDFSEKSLFSELSRMMDAKSIRNRAHKIARFKYGDKTEKKFPSYPGQGIIYTIVVKETLEKVSTFASYIPVVTYNCDVEDSCKNLNNAGVISLVSVLGIIGLFLCFLGHRFFKTELFIFGFLAFSVIFYLLFALTLQISPAVRLVLSGIMGIIGGVLWFTFWYFCGLPLLSVLLVGLVAGFVFGSLLFYTPFGGLSYWNTALTYGLTMACGTLILPVVLLVFTKFLNIFSCVFVGSYCLIFALDTYLHGHLRYIFINSIRHVVISGFYETSYIVPFNKSGPPPQELVTGSYFTNKAGVVHHSEKALFLFLGSLLGTKLLILTIQTLFIESYYPATIPQWTNHCFTSQKSHGVCNINWNVMLCVVWGCLMIGGIVFQLYREKGKAPFPPCPYSQRKLKDIPSTGIQTDNDSGERQSLIQNADQLSRYGSDSEPRSIPT